MKYKIPFPAAPLLLLFMLSGACERDSAPTCRTELVPTDTREEIQRALDRAGPGCTVAFGEGTYELDETLRVDGKSGLTLEGRGRGSTVLSFAGAGPDESGILVTDSRDILARDFTIRDPSGSGIVFVRSHGIAMRRLGAVWSGEPSGDNGEYGFYPIRSTNILIEECYAYGATDAGIYVGQSDGAIIRNSTAEGNVIGIEVSNAANVDVYGNRAADNTAGIIVLNLPGLSRYGERTRVFDNRVEENSRLNFAHEEEIAAQVPAGTGILLLSARQAEIFGNTLSGNNVAGTAVASYRAFAELGISPEAEDPEYNPYPGGVYIHGNDFHRTNLYPDPDRQPLFGSLLQRTFGEDPIPDLLLDGIFAPESGESGGICLENNSGSRFANLRLTDDFPENISFDGEPHFCSMDPLPEVVIDVPGE